MPLPQDIRPVFQDIQDTLVRSEAPWIEQSKQRLDDRNHRSGVLRFISSLQAIKLSSKFRSLAAFKNPST